MVQRPYGTTAFERQVTILWTLILSYLATYTCEWQIISQTIKKKIKAFQLKCNRNILRIPHLFLQYVNIEEDCLINIIVSWKLNYFGLIEYHVGLKQKLWKAWFFEDEAMMMDTEKERQSGHENTWRRKLVRNQEFFQPAVVRATFCNRLVSWWWRCFKLGLSPVLTDKLCLLIWMTKGR